jgi:diguanylate cyclase (GGDEF)-like protein
MNAAAPIDLPAGAAQVSDEYAQRERDRLVGNLRASLNLGLGSCLLVVTIGLLSRAAPVVYLSVAGAIALVVPYGLLAAGRVRSAAVVLAVIPLALVTVYSATGVGLRDVSAAGLPVVILYAALTLGRRGFAAIFALVMAALAFIELNQAYLWLPLRTRSGDPWTDLELMTALVLIAAAVALMLAENVREGLATARDEIERRKRAEAELEALTASDSLTGVSSRRMFDEQVARLSTGRSSPVSVIAADIDGLKKVNDSLGHAVGDSLLVSAARILAASVRSEDVLARIGGDEFAILLPSTNEAAAQSAVDRIEELLRGQVADEGRPRVSLSVGHATAEPGELVDALKLADARMYVSKAERKAAMAADRSETG